MTFKQSKLLDILLKDFTKPEYIGNGGLTSIDSVTQGNKDLILLPELFVKELLIIIKSQQIKTGIPLLQGSFSYLVHNSNISIFLKNGGFKKIYWENFIKNIFKYLIPLSTLLILIYVNFIKKSDLENKKGIEKNSIKKELMIIDTTDAKKKGLKKLNKKENYENNLKTNKSE